MNVPLLDLTSLINIYSDISLGHLRLGHLSALLPDLRMCSRQHFGVKVGIPFSWYSLSIRLSTNLNLYSKVCISGMPCYSQWNMQ